MAARLNPATTASAAGPPTITAGSRRVPVSNLDKVLYPSGFTKRHVLDYYLRVAPVMLPHLAGRGVTLKRYPNGTAAEPFFEKRCPSHRPAWVRTREVLYPTGTAIRHCTLNDAAALVWAANLAALEFHVPLALAARSDRPTSVVFDFDPGAPAGVRDCARLALSLREVLGRLGLQCFAKSSGGKGLHVYVPLNTPGVTFDDTKAFARAVATAFERDDPARVTAAMAKSGRAGRVFVDWSQNDVRKTTACAYSLRAGPRPTVSAPVDWGTLRAVAAGRVFPLKSLDPASVLASLGQSQHPFTPVCSLKQRLPKS